MADELAIQSDQQPFIRRPRLLTLAIALVFLGALLNTLFLFNHCPFEFTADESHYWMWSQRLDYGYYSKPPGIAWVLAAAQWTGDLLHLTGDHSGTALMPVLRMPAVLFGLLSGLLSIALARRIFRDDRVALAVTLLSAAVPMFAIGSLLITIDSPMYLCWAATAYCLWRVIESSSQPSTPNTQISNLKSQISNPETRNSKPETRNWLYVAGLTAALGMLFKPVLIAIPICVALAAWRIRLARWRISFPPRDPIIHRAFATKHALGALALMLASQIPVILWNAHHGWVTFRHIATQGGIGAQAGDATAPPATPLQTFLLNPLSRLGSYLGGQAGGMGGLIFLLLLLAIYLAFQKIRTAKKVTPSISTPIPYPLSPIPSRYTFLLALTLPLWLFYFLMNLWKGTEVNWPAASYFTGMILLAAITVERWHSPNPKTRRDTRGWTIATILWGILLTAVVTNMHRLYPLFAQKLQPLAGTPAYEKSWWNPRKWDPAASKLEGFQSRADAVESVREQMRNNTLPSNSFNADPDPLLITDRYDTASSLNFYLPNHPFVFCLMSSLGGRQSQFDLWPGLDQRSLISDTHQYLYAGRSALLIDIPMEDPKVRALMEKSFTTIGPPESLPIIVNGITLKYVTLYRATGFRAPPGTKGEIF